MDIMSPEKRSALMSRIRGRDTGIERTVQEMLQGLRLQHEVQVRELPGTPDFVLRDARVAVFVDGDFWHGWRFPAWEHKLSPKWRDKIAENRRRDRRNFARLRRQGWTVIRLWEHGNRESAGMVLSAPRPGRGNARLPQSSRACHMTSDKTRRFAFKPRARLLELLGEQLIRDPHIALFELVKNAYDADASMAEVQLRNTCDKDKGTIAVLDDGSGMKVETVVDVWLQPGTDYRQQQRDNHERTPLFPAVAARREGYWTVCCTQAWKGS